MKYFIEDTDGLFKVIFAYNKNNRCSLWGEVGHCDKLISFVRGGSKEFNSPDKFTIQAWEGEERYLKHLHDINYTGVKWINVQHALPTDSYCWGMADFTYENKLITECDSEECFIPQTEQYVDLCSPELIEKYKSDIPMVI